MIDEYDGEYRGGRNKWIALDQLTPQGLALTHYEPGEVVEIRNVKFRIKTISLEPAFMVLEIVEN